MSIRVLVFEDRPQYQELVRGHLEDVEDMDLVGCFSTVWNVLQIVKCTKPDVILMDLEMPSKESALDDRAGIYGIMELTEHFGDNRPAIIVLTHLVDDERIFEAFCVGGSIGYLIKPASKNQIINCIRQANDGYPFSTAYIANSTKRILSNPINKRNASLLSKRELEALTYLKQGYSQKEAADRMGISSVSDPLKSIYKKLQVHSQRQAENKVWFNHLAVVSWLKSKFQ